MNKKSAKTSTKEQIATELYNKLMSMSISIKDFGLCFYEEDVKDLFRSYGVKIDD